MRVLIGILGAVLMALAVMLGVAYVRAPRSTAVKPGQSAPDLTLGSLWGEGRARLSSLRGSAGLLFFFDTRWPRSTALVLSMERLHRAYQGRGLRVMGVCLDEDVTAARAFVAARVLTFAIVSDPGGRIARPAWGAIRRPESYLLDPRGVVEAVWVDPLDWKDPEVAAKIERHLPAGSGARP